MWKELLLIGFASVVLREADAQGGAESLSFHGYLPIEKIRSQQPRGDNQPNDVYLQLVRRPQLREDEDVYYPPNLAGFGLEFGQDPEHRVYQVYAKQEVDELRRKEQLMFGKHSKGGHSKGSHSKGSHSKGSHSKGGNKEKSLHTKPGPPPPAPVQHSKQPSHPPPPPPPPSRPPFRSQERINFPSSHERINFSSSHERRPSYRPSPPKYPQKVAFPPPLPHYG